MKQKLLVLKNNLSDQGLHKQAGRINQIIKIAITDEQLSAREDSRIQRVDAKKAEVEKEVSKKIPQNSRDFSAVVDSALDLAGLIPGFGAIADVASLAVHLRIENWILAVLDLIGLIPEIGSWAKLSIKSSGRISKVILKKHGNTLLEFCRKYLTRQVGYDSLITTIQNFIQQANIGKDIDLRSGNPIASDLTLESEIKSRLGDA